jgi:antitoxin component YwqK of YwqJK toxin-antitoxin module
MNGSFINWYKNGKKKSEENFKNDLKHGEFKYWDEGGNLTKEESYIEGEQVKKTEK